MLRMLLYSLSVAFQMIWSKRFRSLLSIVGIVFGVATLLVTVAIAQGTRKQILKTIESFGESLVRLSPGASIQAEGKVHYVPLTGNDLQSLSETLQGVEAMSPTMTAATMIRSERGEAVFGVLGMDADFSKIRDFQYAWGRNFTSYELTSHSRVCLVGTKVAEYYEYDLLNEEDEKWIYLWDSPYRVVGVIDKKGRGMGGNIDNMVFVPITNMQEILGRIGEVQEIWIKADQDTSTKMLVRQIKNHFLNKPNPRRDIEVWDQELILTEKEKITKAFAIALGSIALVALIISGIGLMNMLLVSIAERIHEIGLRKAMGALPVDILLQFLFEALLLCAVGSIGGVVLGFSLADTVAVVLNNYIHEAHPWQAQISWDVVLIAFQFTFLVGIFFGLYPAWRAAKMDPAQALTYH